MFSRLLRLVRDEIQSVRDFLAVWNELPRERPAHLLSDEEIDALPEEAT